MTEFLTHRGDDYGKSEVRGQKSEVRNRKSVVGNLWQRVALKGSLKSTTKSYITYSYKIINT